MKTIISVLFVFLSTLFQSRATLQFEIVALCHQLTVYQRMTLRPRVQQSADRLFWSWLSRSWSDWRSALVFVQPGTVIAWQRKWFRDHWAKLSQQGRPGRPLVSKEIRALIRKISVANPNCVSPRIVGEVRKLGIDVAKSTVDKYRVRSRQLPSPTWKTFLKNHATDLVSIDFFVVPTVGFKVLFVLVVLAHRSKVMPVSMHERIDRKSFLPAYLSLGNRALDARAATARQHLADCDLCARYCHINRLETARGAVCRTAEHAVANGFGPHHGEEDPLRGRRGSGTIFFTWCSLRCVFCQNWEISQRGLGEEVEAEELAGMMLALQAQGCPSINLVTPSHVVAQIIQAVAIAAPRGLRLPLVYNTGGYDSPEALALLDGIIDIYMPDMKYGDSGIARRYSVVRDYVEINQAAVKEMHHQVGDLVLDEQGIAQRGLLVRHLVLPENLAGTEQVLAFIAREISPDTYVNLMDQYRPCYRADEHPPLDRSLYSGEVTAALEMTRKYGLHRLDRRDSRG
jgi:putative pyruvate formate lyase activating enzyme